MSSILYSTTITNLPLLPMAHLVKTLDVKSLINLSKTADIFKQFIQLLHIPSGGYHICVRSHRVDIYIPSRNYSQSFHHSSKFILINAMYDIHEELSDLLPGNLDYLNIDPDLVSYFDAFNQKCTVLSVGEKSYEYSEANVECMDDCTSEDLDILLDGVDFQKGLALNGPIELRTEHYKIFNIDWLQVRNSSWITPEFLRKLKNKVIFLADIWTLTEQNINEFICDMRDGKINENLQVIGFGRYGGWNTVSILQGIQVVEQRDQVYKLPEYDPRIMTEKFLPRGFNSDGFKIKESYDFIRNDGIKCSIQFWRSTIRIYVWNQKKEGTVTKKRWNTNDINGSPVKKHS
ncbi:hypothetical protein GCK72_000984 [Caenorhabditis remanei]|uniref:F-box domain-containing protein n=1 Tax=Caenorhabditis remanei TaxID=31234 RepID=A0A6A5HLU0_CAERE|nr:hypothetical protein GCK72_000984 [Caenorhabditis remanei]KAF1769170.1 hypothetical protein GCK72_000984 [Caenorhabditis remanei]